MWKHLAFLRWSIHPGVITVAGIIEYSHRIQASVVGMLVLILTISVWLVYRKDFRVKLLAFFSPSL